MQEKIIKQLGFSFIVVFILMQSGCLTNSGLPTNATRDAREKPSDMIVKENKYWLSKGQRAAKREMRRRKRHYRRFGTYS